jgi:DnaJ-domain-containing protein 1
MKQELEKVKDDGTAEVVVESKEENKEEPIEIEPKGSLVGKNKEEVNAVVEKEESKTESENDEESDDLSSYSTNVQKRIQKLTFEKREAERIARGAVEHAKGVQRKLSEYEKNNRALEEGQLKEFNARVEAQQSTVKEELKKALENQDYDKIMESQSKMTELAVQKERARLITEQRIQEEAQRKEQAELQANQPQVNDNIGQTLPQPSAKASSWAQENEWFGNDTPMTRFAYGLHDDLLQQGVDPESDAYYNEINRQMREYFPHKFASKQERRQPVQTVSPAGRTSNGRRTVRLTKRQVEMAKKLNVPLTEYAKYVKEGM